MILPHQDTYAGVLIQQAQAALREYHTLFGEPVLGNVLDLGAHYGCFTMAALEQGATHVLAVEASAVNYAGLIQNLRANGAFPWSAVPVYGAAWEGDEGTLVNLRRAAAGNSGQYSLYFDERAPIVERVPSLSFSMLFASCPWDYVKCDIEGGEWSWLTGPEALKTALGFMRCLDIEIHPLDNAEYFAVPETPIHVEDVATWATACGARVVQPERQPTRLLILPAR